MENLKNSYIVVPISFFLTFTYLYMSGEAKTLNQAEKLVYTCLKTSMFVSILITIILYINFDENIIENVSENIKSGLDEFTPGPANF